MNKEIALTLARFFMLTTIVYMTYRYMCNN